MDSVDNLLFFPMVSLLFHYVVIDDRIRLINELSELFSTLDFNRSVFYTGNENKRKPKDLNERINR